jgi:heme/copper-type cytochrome/quinol oxidase subunit 3
VAQRRLAGGDRRGAVRGFAAAAGLGALFLVGQGSEWVRLIRFGLTVSSGAYGGTFYTLIGAHAVHVLGALLWLGVSLLLLGRGRFAGGRTAPLRACTMYWHFVVGLWPILWASVYLL